MSALDGFPPPVNRDDLGRGPMIMAITWIFQILALGAVVARLAVRRHKRITWGLDDYLMLAAVIIQLALQSLATSSFRNGMGKHDASLYPEEMMTILRDNWVSVPPGIFVGLLSRTSIAILLSRLFSPYKWFTYYLIAFTALMWIVGIVAMPLTYVQVTPVEALWNFTLAGERRLDARIWLYTVYLQQSCCSFSDLTYALFPVIFIWKLKMALSERISLILLMCCSIFSMIMSILKTVSLGEVSNAVAGTPDTQYRSSVQLIYGFTEQSIVIMMGCVPPLRGLIRMNFPKLSSLRYYLFSKGSSPGSYASNEYTDLDTDYVKLNHMGSMKGVTKTSVAVGDSLNRSQYGPSNEELPAQDRITRTDRYMVTIDPRSRTPEERV